MNNPFSYLFSAELSDVGHRRKNNEDSLVSLPEYGVFCVADGMGGVQGGEVASKASVDALEKEFTESPDAAYAVTADASAKLVERALNSASNWIKERAEGLGLSGTGSTAVVLVFDRVTPSQGLALHAGDSRAYRLRGDKLIQLTTDHSVAAAAGLPDDSSLPAMFRGVITRAVGLDRQVQLEATAFDVMPGDIFLLCSDGLSKMVSDRRIQKLLRKHAADSLPDVAKVLVDEALEEGGDDNVSVVLIRVAAELPKGPTMEIPPETLALEQLEIKAGEPAPVVAHEDHDATGQTADTGHTASTMADQDALSPPGGVRGEGVTPTTPDSDRPVVPAIPNTPDQQRRMPPIKRSEASSSSSRIWLWGTLVLILTAAVGTWGYFAWRTQQEDPVKVGNPVLPVTPTNAETHVVEPVVQEHAASTDLHGGAQE
ncbi:MAG: protein phosphatase 2C domain-containing protein [bacterium]